MKSPSGDVLIFDMEARPTAWFGGDFVGRAMTAFACCTLSDPRPYSVVLTRKDRSTYKMAAELESLIADAALSVGHYVRGFDFPLLAAELERNNLPSLGRTLALDTKMDRKQSMGISESLENLAARYDLTVQKMGMHEPWWEEFNLWQTPRSVELVRSRVESDILATRELYIAMEKAGRLKKPKAWDPETSKLPRYRA
jgi:hypothetical protein